MENSQVMCHGQGGLNERPFDGTSKGTNQDQGDPFLSPGNGSSILKRGRRGHATVSIAGYFTGSVETTG